jgi:hypothetical protein
MRRPWPTGRGGGAVAPKTNKQTKTNIHTYKQTYERTNEHTYIHTNERTNEQTNKRGIRCKLTAARTVKRNVLGKSNHGVVKQFDWRDYKTRRFKRPQPNTTSLM